MNTERKRHVSSEDPGALLCLAEPGGLDAEAISLAMARASAEHAEWIARNYPHPRRSKRYQVWLRPEVVAPEGEPSPKLLLHWHERDSLDEHPWPRLIYVDSGRRLPALPTADEAAEINYRRRRAALFQG